MSDNAPSLRAALRLAVILSFFSLDPAAAAGSSYHGIPEPALEFARDRVADGRTLLFGPGPRQPPPIAPGSTCIDLYHRRVALMRADVHYRPPYWDDPRNKAAVFLGTIFTPAFYFLGFSAVTAYLDSAERIGLQAELDALRFASAQLRCFER